jgi:hypothetical protein
MNVLTRLIIIKDVWFLDTFCCLTNWKYDSDRMHFLGKFSQHSQATVPA